MLGNQENTQLGIDAIDEQRVVSPAVDGHERASDAPSSNCETHCHLQCEVNSNAIPVKSRHQVDQHKGRKDRLLQHGHGSHLLNTIITVLRHSRLIVNLNTWNATGTEAFT